MELYKSVSACVVLINPEGLILAVSRKDDHNSMGLPGGKGEIEDNGDPMVTAIRECKEETGLDVSDLQLVFAIHKSGNMGYTYLAKYSGEINHNEPHVVKWVPMEVLINGSFGRYNQMVSESLMDMGIDFELDIDIIALTDEVDEYLQNNKLLGMTFKLDEIRKELNYFDRGVYTVYFDVKSDEFLWDIDNEFIDGLEALGQKHGVKLQIPYYYYSK